MIIDEPKRTYLTTDTHPGTLPFATIYMGGLLCFSFDRNRKCTVGVNQVGGGHTWKFRIVERGASGEPVLDLNQGNSNFQEFHIDVAGGATGGSYVFNGQQRVSIPAIKKHRFNLESSWIDLEGPRGHNTRIENDPGTLWPRFYLNEGLFCASKLSSGSFLLRDSKAAPLVKQLGPVALEVVADIFLDTGQRRKIDIKCSYGTAYKTVPLDPDKRYKIYILNDCDSCGPYYYDDFPLHYKSFSMIKAADQFHLIPDNSTSATSATESVVALTGDDYSKATDWASDRAPCMGSAFGQTSTFNA